MNLRVCFLLLTGIVYTCSIKYSTMRYKVQAQRTRGRSKTTPVLDSHWRTTVRTLKTSRNRRSRGNRSTSAPTTMSAFTRSLKTSAVPTSASVIPKSLSTMSTPSTTTTASPSMLTTLSTTYTSTSNMPTSSSTHTSSSFICTSLSTRHTSTSTISMSTSTTPLSISTDPHTASGTRTVTSTSTTAAVTGETMAVGTNYTTTQFLPPSSTTATATTPAEVTTKAKPLADIHALHPPLPEWQASTEIPSLLSSTPPDFTSNNNSNRSLMLTLISELTTPRENSLDENKLNELTLFSFNTSSVLVTVNKSLAWKTLAVAKPEPETGSSRLSDINSTPTFDSVSTTALPALQSTTSIYFSDDIISESTSFLLSASAPSAPSSTATANSSATSLPGSRVTTQFDSSEEITSLTVVMASLTHKAIESFSHDTSSASRPTQRYGASLDRNGTSDEKNSAGVDSHNQTTLGYGRSHLVKHQISDYLPLIVGGSTGFVVGLFLISSLVFFMDRRLHKRREQKLEEEQKKIFSTLEGNPYRV